MWVLNEDRRKASESPFPEDPDAVEWSLPEPCRSSDIDSGESLPEP
jgi:hypothetical protein